MTETKNYQLNIFEEEQSDLTFKEFRQLLAGTESSSNMQKIDTLLGEMRDIVQEIIGNEDTDGIINHQIKEALSEFEDKYSETIFKDDDGIYIGGQGESGRPIDFNDGTQISQLKNGIFTVNGVKVDQLRCGDYVAKYNANNKHLQISYQETNGGV